MMEVSFEEKIKALEASIRTTTISVIAVFIIVPILQILGYQLPVNILFIISFIALCVAALQYYLIKKRWLIDFSYDFLYAFLIYIIVVVSIYYSGSIISPVVFIALIAVTVESITYSFNKAFYLALGYTVFLWVINLLQVAEVIPQIQLFPNLIPYKDLSFTLSMLIGYTLAFFAFPFTAGRLAERLRSEKRVALAMAEEIKKLYNDLKVVDRMKTEFLSMVSHELRTPITPIKGFTSLMLMEKLGPVTDQQKEALNTIQKDSDHLLKLIDSVLEVTRMERGVELVLEKGPVSMATLVNELVEAMNSETGASNIKIEVMMPDDLPAINADYKMITRLLTNILGNAFKFTPKGGRITIKGSEAEGGLKIEVKDNGIGIARENLQKIFDKFYQVDSSYTREAGGVGLGLAVAKEIVEAHKGRIWAESDGLGRGTRLCFVLPLV